MVSHSLIVALHPFLRNPVDLARGGLKAAAAARNRWLRILNVFGAALVQEPYTTNLMEKRTRHNGGNRQREAGN